MAQFATVAAITGNGRVFAVDAQGNSRQLQVGDSLQRGETVRTVGDARVELLMEDGRLLAVAPAQSVRLDENVAESDQRPTAQDSAVTTPATVDTIIQALERGTDLSQALEATAAGLGGGGAGADGGTSFVQLLRITEGVDPLTYNYSFTAPDLPPDLQTQPVTAITSTLTLSADPVVFEGSQGVTYTATLGTPALSDMSITLSNGAVIVIPAGSTSSTVLVPVQGDDVYQDGETLQASVDTVQGGGITLLTINDSNVITVVNDTIDTTLAKVSVSVLDGEGEGDVSHVVEGNALTFRFSVDHVPQADLILNVTIGGVVQTVTIAAGTLHTDVTVDTRVDDLLVQGSSTITGTINNVSPTADGNYEQLDFSGASASAIVVDDHDVTQLQLFAVTQGESGPVYSAVNAMTEEGRAQYVVLSVDATGNPLASQPGGTVTVNVGAPIDTATQNVDYTVAATVTATVGMVFSMAAINDAIDENSETFTLSLGADWSLASTYENVVYISDSVTTTITDNDTPSIDVAGIETQNVTVTEGAEAVFTINVTGAAAGSTVTLTLADGTAVAADYHQVHFQSSTDGGVSWQAVSGAISVPTGDSTLQVRTDTYQDLIDENDETFTLTGKLTSLGVDYSDTATATIVDNDHLPAPVADLGSAVEGTTALSLLHVLANDTDADGDTLSVSQFATDAVGTNGANANGSNTVTTVLGGTVTMNANGTFTYTAPVRDHSTLGDDQDSFYYKATDGTNLSGWTLVRIDITDTVPSIAPINTILQNESGLVVAGVDLGLVLSADVSPTTVKLSLAHTETVSGKTYILTEADARMSSDAVDLLVRYNADGSIDAVKDDGSGTVIFSITPNVATGTYSINLIGPLDGADGTDFAFGSAYKGGNTSVIFVGETSDTPLYTDPDNNGSYTATDPAALVIRATGSTNGTASTINASNFSIGVGNGQDVSPGDRMVLEFTEASSWVGTKSGGNIQLAQAGASIAYESLVGLTFNVAQIETNEVVAFELRSGGATGSVVAAGTLTFSGPTLSGNSFEHVVVGDGADPVQGHFTLSFSDPIGSATFDTAVFTSGTYDYKIGSIEAITAEQGFDQVIDVIATATDGDLTLSDPVGFSVTFDGTGAIEGTAGNEVLAGGVGSDAFKWNFGDTGADVIKDFSVAPLASGGDVLDLKDLLLNEHDGTGINTSNLTQYLHFTEVAGKVVLSLDHDGGATFVADQTIQLDNFSSVSAFATALGAASASDADIISKMIATGHLNTDV